MTVQEILPLLPEAHRPVPCRVLFIPLFFAQGCSTLVDRYYEADLSIENKTNEIVSFISRGKIREIKPNERNPVGTRSKGIF